MHGKSDGEVERVESSLVNDNEVVPATKKSANRHITGRNINLLLEREFVQVDVVFRRGNEVDQLAELSLEGSL